MSLTYFQTANLRLFGQTSEITPRGKGSKFAGYRKGLVFRMYYVAIGIVIAVFIWRIAAGFRKGMIGEIISLISLIIAVISLAVLLLAAGSYFSEERWNFLLMLLALVVIGFIYKILNALFTSLKLITKLPIISGLNRILGAVLGAVEAVLIILVLIEILKYFSFAVPGADIV